MSSAFAKKILYRIRKEFFSKLLNKLLKF